MDFGVVAEPLGRDGSCGVALTPYVPGMHGKPSRLKPLLGSRSLPSVTLAAEGQPLAACTVRTPYAYGASVYGTCRENK